MATVQLGHRPRDELLERLLVEIRQPPEVQAGLGPACACPTPPAAPSGPGLRPPGRPPDPGPGWRTRPDRTHRFFRSHRCSDTNRSQRCWDPTSSRSASSPARASPSRPCSTRAAPATPAKRGTHRRSHQWLWSSLGSLRGIRTRRQRSHSGADSGKLTWAEALREATLEQPACARQSVCARR